MAESVTRLRVRPGSHPAPSPFTTALSTLKIAGLKACLLRAAGDVLSWDTEIDLLVAPRHLRAALQLLGKLGWERLDVGLFQPGRHHLVLLHDGKLLKIDLYTAVISDNISYIDAEAYLANAGLSGDAWLPASDDWLLHIVIHTILEKPCLDRKYQYQLAQALNNPGTVVMAREKARLRGLAHLFDNDPLFSYLFDRQQVAALKSGTRAALLRYRPSNYLRLAWYRMMQKFGKNLFLRRGFSIAVVGPDGAGKSTFIAALERALQDHGIRTAQAYMGPWERPVLPTSMLLRRLGASPEDFGPKILPRRTPVKIFKAHVRRLLYYANFAVEQWARYAVRVLPFILERRVVLFDRHALDLQVGYYNEPMQNLPWLRALLVRLSPRPRMFILLENNPDEVWRRKREFPLPLIASSMRRYLEVAKDYDAVVLKTDRSADALARDLVLRHWREFVQWRREGFRFFS
jgi:thymidylate kinase